MKAKKNKISSVIDCVIITIELVLILVLTFGKIFNKTPSIFGYSFYSIATGSMTPTLKVNDVIISKEYTDDMELEIGDIITYNGTTGSYAGKKITHRIVDIEETNGIVYITTKGDNNQSEDPVITSENVVSKMTYKTVVISFLFKVLSNFFGFLLLIICPILFLLISAIIDYVKSSKEEDDEEENSENEKQNKGDSNESVETIEIKTDEENNIEKMMNRK